MKMKMEVNIAVGSEDGIEDERADGQVSFIIHKLTTDLARSSLMRFRMAKDHHDLYPT